MAKRSQISHDSFVADGVDIPTSTPYNSNVDRKTVALRSRMPARVIRIGPVTGERYEWPDAGSVVSVYKEDSDQLLNLAVGGDACCGNQASRFHLFEVA